MVALLCSAVLRGAAFSDALKVLIAKPAIPTLLDCRGRIPSPQPAVTAPSHPSLVTSYLLREGRGTLNPE